MLVVWDSEGKMMPNEEGRRLADAFPDSRFVELADCYTLIPLDQPRQLARGDPGFRRLTGGTAQGPSRAKIV